MASFIERASSGRSKCRGCGGAIRKDALRLGERLPNPFADGEMTHWFHPACAAYKRPDALLEALESLKEAFADQDRLADAARRGVELRRLHRLSGAERAPSGRARCRSCRERIEKDGWRVVLVFYDEGRFEPSGFVHAGCAAKYFETTDLLDRIRHFSPEIDVAELADLEQSLTTEVAEAREP